MSSWKTTASAIVLFFTVALGVVSSLLDNNPSTNPQWEIVIPQLIAAVGLVFARDNNVTSEQAGAK